MSKVEWLCSRCSEKTGKKTEPDPVVLRLCTECKVQNWVRPYGHAGEAVQPTPEETEEAKVFHEHKMKVLKENTKIRKEKEAEQYQEAEKRVTEVKETLQEEPQDETVAEEAEEPTEAEADAKEPDPKEEEIAKLKAKIAELEK